jgi:hypothetical protein
MSESSPPFRRAQVNLSAPWMAPARCPMLQQGLKCFKQKIKIKINLVSSSVAFQSPRPHGGAVVHDGSVGGEGGLKFFYFFYFLFFFLKHFNSPAPMEEPSCTTARPWGRGDWNAIV